LSGRRIQAWKVRIEPAGFFSFVWQAHYWFRQGDLLFIQYKGRNGPPGTPLTVIRLIGPGSSNGPGSPCAGHGASVMGCKSTVGRDVRNHESEATAASRGVVGMKPETRPWSRRTGTG
jgi:hypothetical protein